MKVGIVTLYHDSTNYGGNLQAYALQQICQNLGYDAEVISYENYSKFKYGLVCIKRRMISVGNYILHNNRKYAYQCVGKRKKSVTRFNKAIPHSPVFFRETIVESNKIYDCFIVGSDQVWNPSWLNPFLSLEFVDKEKYCFSYAASMGVSKLENEQKNVFKEMLSRMDAVSVREDNAIPILEELTDKKVEWVLDPTLVLDAEQWNKLAADRKIKEKYIFCFLFGNQEKPRRLAKQYAAKHNCKIVTIPFLRGAFRECDVDFGDCRLSEVSPKQFLSLIKYAECIFTDSFHATAFSHIFEKRFIAYAENTHKMRVRMLSLTELFGTQARFIGDEIYTDIEYIESLPDMDYENSKTKFLKMKEFSMNFLKSNLKWGENA